MLRKKRWDPEDVPKPGETASLIDYGLAVVREATSAGGTSEANSHAHFSVSPPRSYPTEP